ncbi:disease resistance protein Pik-2-like [Pistacia vera]|uniref:disease resistance protein Pik-2-like n=1 Tax=Pistacia vera TaxID=55513 RepID=UPI0012634A20|nr:disease resistance protein Pik-2-like [Pistacia vera]
MAEIAVGAAISIINRLINGFLANSQRKEQATVTDFDSIKKCLNTMQAYLKDTEEIREVTEGFKDQVKQVRDLAYEIKDAIEEYMLEVPDHFHEHKITKILHRVAHPVTDKKPLSRLLSSVETIKVMMKGIEELDRFRILPSERASRSSGAVCYPKVMDYELVGIEKRRDELINLIRSRESRKMVVSVFGDRGSGKTTLIEEVHEKLKEDFECHALVSVPHPVPVEGISDKICAAMEIPVPNRPSLISITWIIPCVKPYFFNQRQPYFRR